MLITLTAYGNNKLVATKELVANGVEFKETQEVIFKSNKASLTIVTYQFETEEDANNYYKTISIAVLQDMVEIQENKVIMTITHNPLGKSKTEYKKQLKEAGYEVN